VGGAQHVRRGGRRGGGGDVNDDQTDHELDSCECGDYRRDHPNNGRCKMNGLGHGIPGYTCDSFELSSRFAGAVTAIATTPCRKRVTNSRGGCRE
jgi:hypothetical protein